MCGCVQFVFLASIIQFKQQFSDLLFVDSNDYECVECVSVFESIYCFL